jgi:DNA-binding winged helix-turn-helix (wHTH) protein
VLEKLIDILTILKNYLQNGGSYPANLFFIKAKKKSIFINDVKIVSEETKLQYAILDLLIEHYFNSYVTDRVKYEYLSAKQLISMLVKYEIVITHEEQIRRSIKLLRKYIQEKIGENCIIKTIHWKGYMLNPTYVKLG